MNPEHDKSECPSVAPRVATSRSDPTSVDVVIASPLASGRRVAPHLC
jgi:hypothetical protein